MKEIKFRLLNEYNKIVGYEKWFIGNFNKEIKKDYYVTLPKWLYSKDNTNYEKKYIEHRLKEQFTDLLDKKGNYSHLLSSDLLATDWEVIEK